MISIITQVIKEILALSLAKNGIIFRYNHLQRGDYSGRTNLIGLTNFISTVIGPNLTSCHVKLILLTPLGSKIWKLGAFGLYIPRNCSKTWLKRNVFQSRILQPWNRECVKCGALEGGLIFRCSLTWDEVLQPVCCCFELKVTGFYLGLVFTASLSEV